MTIKAYMERILKTLESNKSRPALNKAETAKYLGISARTVEELKRSYAIPFVRIGGRVVFLTADLDKFLRQRRVNCLNDDKGGTHHGQ